MKMKLISGACLLSTFALALGAESTKKNTLRGSTTNEEAYSLPLRELRAVNTPDSERIVTGNSSEGARFLKSGKDQATGDAYPADFYASDNEDTGSPSKSKKAKDMKALKNGKPFAKENVKKSFKDKKVSKFKLVK
mmetsp:Transcript_12925/g.30208  ORF Transcript_12925/g.30208 Transcript_12925/m.30208 type:complete len:136 (-) Transcript_12925:377-784(-)